jgi:primosomal protein N''
MTFEEALAQIEAAVRESTARRSRNLSCASEATPSLKRGLSRKWCLRQAFERIVGELTAKAKSSALASLASLTVPESQRRN